MPDGHTGHGKTHDVDGAAIYESFRVPQYGQPGDHMLWPGHIHGDRWLDIPFPRRVRGELLTAGLAEQHHILPESGWITFRLREEADVAEAVGLLRRSYNLAVKQRTK